LIRQIFIERRRIDLALKRLHAASSSIRVATAPPRFVLIDERLFAEPVAASTQPIACAIPDTPARTFPSMCLRKSVPSSSYRCTSVSVSPCVRKRWPDLPGDGADRVVIDFAVEDDPDRSFRSPVLVATGDVNDRKAPMPERHARHGACVLMHGAVVRIKAFVVGAAVAQAIGHADQRLARNRARGSVQAAPLIPHIE